MTGGFMVVVERVVEENIYMPLVCEDMVIILPVGETRPEHDGDILQGSL